MTLISDCGLPSELLHLEMTVLYLDLEKMRLLELSPSSSVHLLWLHTVHFLSLLAMKEDMLVER